MDSQITLVPEPPFPSTTNQPSTLLVLDRDSVFNAHLLRPGTNERVYTISSNDTATQTTLRRVGSDMPIAVVTRHTILPEEIALHGGPPMKLKKWLKSGVLSDFPTSFEEADQKYTWRVNPIGHIALYAEDDPKAPIAWFTPSRKRIVDGAPVQVPASVALQPRGEEIQELVLASLLVVELRARNVRRGQAVAAGRAALTAASAGFPGF